MAQSGRGVLDQTVGQALGGFGGEKRRMCVGQRVELGAHGGDDLGMAVAQARDSRAA